MSLNGIDATVEALRVTLGRASKRAAVSASNLANLDTPGYRAQEVAFDDLLANHGDLETQRTQAGHIGPGEADPRLRGHLRQAPITRMRNDGNTVDLDLEMTLLGKSQGRYRTAAELLRKRFALLIYSATDGRGGV